MNPVNKNTFCLRGKELLRCMGLPVRTSDPKGAIMKCMVRNSNMITCKSVCADSSIVRLLHEPEELNTLIEMFFNCLVIGMNNSLGGHTMSAQTVGSRKGRLTKCAHANVSQLKRSSKHDQHDPSNCHPLHCFLSRTP